MSVAHWFAGIVVSAAVLVISGLVWISASLCESDCPGEATRSVSGLLMLAGLVALVISIGMFVAAVSGHAVRRRRARKPR